METPLADPSKVKRYRSLMIISAFLLALLWPVGSYFFWIFGGLTAYFLFLMWFYSPRQQPEPRQTWSRPGEPTRSASATSASDLTAKVRVIVIIVALFIGFFIFSLILIGIFSGEPEQETPVSYSEQEFDPTNVDDLTSRGNSFYDQQQYDSAMKYYDAVLALDPNNQYGLYNKALVYYTKQDYSISIKLLRRCLSDNPDYGYAYYLLGDDYKAIGRSDSAFICFEKAYDYEVRDVELLQNLGEAYSRKGKRQEAIKIYQEAIGQDSSLIEVYQKLSEIDPQNASTYQREIQKRSN